MNCNDQVGELCARIRAAQDLEEVERAAAELRTLLRHDVETTLGKIRHSLSDDIPNAHPRSRVD